MTSENGERDRADLERAAFGRPRNAADVAAASAALRELARETAPPAVVTAIPPAVVPAAPTAPPADRAADHGPARPAANPIAAPAMGTTGRAGRPRRRVLPLLFAATLIAGIVIGTVIARSVTSSATALPDLGSASPHASVVQANAWLARPQTKADVFPVHGYAITLGLTTRSIHRILTTTDGTTLWIGRTSAAICLLWTAKPDTAYFDTTASTVTSASACATPTAFAASGLTLGYQNDVWSWDGSAFSTTVVSSR